MDYTVRVAKCCKNCFYMISYIEMCSINPLKFKDFLSSTKFTVLKFIKFCRTVNLVVYFVKCLLSTCQLSTLLILSNVNLVYFVNCRLSQSFELSIDKSVFVCILYHLIMELGISFVNNTIILENLLFITTNC